MVTTIIVISVIIVFLVLILSVVTTNKAYKFQHTVDPLEGNPNAVSEESDTKKEIQQ